MIYISYDNCVKIKINASAEKFKKMDMSGCCIQVSIIYETQHYSSSPLGISKLNRKCAI